MAITLVDISRWQGTDIDWTTAKDHGVQAAIIEYKDESGVANPDFSDQWKGARGAGMGVGTYVFCRYDEDVSPQAKDLEGLAEAGPTWADLELPAPSAAEFEMQLLDAAPHAGAYVPRYMIPSDGFLSRINPWTTYDSTYPTGVGARIVQLGPQTVPGFPGEVDLDVYEGSWADFAQTFRLAVRKIPDPPIRHGSHVVSIVGCSTGGYWLASAEGSVYNYGGAPFLGSLWGKPFPSPIMGMAAAGPRGYWLVGEDGGVAAFGAAKFAGPTVVPPPLSKVAEQIRASMGPLAPEDAIAVS